MRSLTDIKRQEREAQVAYIRKLYVSLPKEVNTVFESEQRKVTWEKIENAETELALM